MTIFDKFSVLDPAKMLREIDAETEGDTFTNLSILDQALARRQMHDAGIDVSNAAMLDPSLLLVEVDVAIAADSSPDWVPDDAKIHIDLVNDRAWTEADGEVAISTLLGADANTENAFNTSSYDPQKLTVDGYAGPFLVGFIGSSLAALLAGCTIVIKYKQVDTEAATLNFALVSASGNAAVGVDCVVTGEFQLLAWLSNEEAPTVSNVFNTGLGAVNAVAITTTPTRLEAAVSLSDPLSFPSITNVEYPTTGGDAIVAALLREPTLNNITLQSITIYDALPSTAGLSALSETGVTNTAPTLDDPAYPYGWNDITLGGGFSGLTKISATEATFPFNSSENIGEPIYGVLFADAEGNPLTWTLVNDGGGLFEVAFGVSVRAIGALIVGTHHFTLRASDPGGLYVEQEFTITVTA